jgi:MoxR-like ATPase
VAAGHSGTHARLLAVIAVAGPVMRHRLACNFTAQAEGIATDKVIQRLLAETPQTERQEAKQAEDAAV